jgi:hypothetical protein
MICFTIILLVLRNPSLRKLKGMFVLEFWLKVGFGVLGRIWNVLPGGILIASLYFELVCLLSCRFIMLLLLELLLQFLLGGLLYVLVVCKFESLCFPTVLVCWLWC